SVSSSPLLGESARDDTAQVARRRARIVLERERRNYRNAVSAGGNRLAGIAAVDPGDGAERKCRRTAAEDGDNARQATRTDRRGRVVLGGGRQNPPDTPIKQEIEWGPPRPPPRFYPKAEEGRGAPPRAPHPRPPGLLAPQ